ncbi:uncharacterized protein LAESUDRAFT_759371 [Laetiporus sulphureus 93-53]|uniref:Myb/SANT-like domain-containing protein n=1 Tax=Laetiporus sulphureus 93-53 TaxID=1314785 RepID=A0A165E9S0_9APHY|nr:uncharacterized protein LAESUDRAFT_759371 [Laetiporus sulphureus 93-53]KZT06548.1 hypothetical protein LAESUDRAFT_759371 [Laetiporus sulphureus 93-53]
MAKAQAEIVLWVEEDQLKLLEEEKDPRECWLKLHDIHRAKGFTMELAKWWAFYYAWMQESESGQRWITRVKGLVRALKEVDVEVKEIQKLLVLVMGLTDKYGWVVSQVDNMDIKEWTFDQISVKILNEETRHGGPDGADELEMLKADFLQVQKLRDLSGYEWDDEKIVMVTEEPVIEVYIQAHPKVAQWLITHPFPLCYEILELMEGKVMTEKGAFHVG